MGHLGCATAVAFTRKRGVYGMNFEHMPELKWELGYPLVLVVMVSICTGLFRSFKRAGWL